MSSETKEKEMIKPGDLVKLNPKYCSQENINYYGLGLYLESKPGLDCVYWFKRMQLTRTNWFSLRLIRVG